MTIHSKKALAHDCVHPMLRCSVQLPPLDLPLIELLYPCEKWLSDDTDFASLIDFWSNVMQPSLGQWVVIQGHIHSFLQHPWVVVPGPKSISCIIWIIPLFFACHLVDKSSPYEERLLHQESLDVAFWNWWHVWFPINGSIVVIAWVAWSRQCNWPTCRSWMSWMWLWLWSRQSRCWSVDASRIFNCFSLLANQRPRSCGLSHFAFERSLCSWMNGHTRRSISAKLAAWPDPGLTLGNVMILGSVRSNRHILPRTMISRIWNGWVLGMIILLLQNGIGTSVSISRQWSPNDWALTLPCIVFHYISADFLIIKLLEYSASLIHSAFSPMISLNFAHRHWIIY